MPDTVRAALAVVGQRERRALAACRGAAALVAQAQRDRRNYLAGLAVVTVALAVLVWPLAPVAALAGVLGPELAWTRARRGSRRWIDHAHHVHVEAIDVHAALLDACLAIDLDYLPGDA